MEEHKPERYNVKVNHPRKGLIEVPVYRPAGEDEEYLIMKDAADYIGRARYTSDLLINEKVEAGEMEQFRFTGRPIYVKRSDLDRLKEEMRRPKPLPPRDQRQR